MHRRAVAVAVVVSLLTLVLTAAPQPARTDTASLAQQLQALQQQIDADQQALAANQRQRDLTRQQLEELQVQLAGTRRQLAALQAELAAKESALAVTAAQATAAARQLQLDRQLLGVRLRAMYENGNVSLLAVVLGAHGFSDFLSRLTLLETVVAQDAALVARVRADQARLAALSKTLAAQEQQLAGTSQWVAAAASRQAASESALTAALQRLAAARAQEIAQLEEDQAAAQEVQDAINRLAGHAPLTHTLHFIWPVVGPITSPFGWRWHPILHRESFHTGIDIGVPEGTPIHAAEAGRVIFVGALVADGNTVIIDHGGGYTTVYAHQSRFAVQVGQWVSRGQVIGYVGHTGWATGPHLHFEVRVDNKPENPLLYLP